MADLKQLLLESLNELPEGLQDFLDTTIQDDWVATSLPDTVEDAIIVSGVLCHNLNMFLWKFQGFTPLKLFLRIGQHNPVVQSILLSGLEYLTKAQHDFVISSPDNQQQYQVGVPILFEIQATSPDVVLMATVQIGSSSPVQLLKTPGTSDKWSLAFPMSTGGQYTLTWSVTWKDINYAASHTSTFTVV